AGGAATYRLPQPSGRRRAAPAPRAARSAPTRRLSTSEAIRRRPRVASAVAGTIAFIAAVYLGTVLFSPDTPDTPDTGTTPTAEVDAPAEGSAGDGTGQNAQQDDDGDGDDE
ncbi:MAG TPA: serine/threonine protein kinase, partial [Streptomyces sp.]|nr:serine/threonine protein kinase [Streptomyces sp.]